MSVEVCVHKVERRCEVLDEEAGGAQQLLRLSLGSVTLTGASQREVEQVVVNGRELLN